MSDGFRQPLWKIRSASKGVATYKLRPAALDPFSHTHIHLQVFGSTFKICSAPSYFPPLPRLLYSHHIHLNVNTVQSSESLCGSKQPRITLCHPSNHSTRHVTHGAKVRAFPENPGASLRPSLWPSPHTFRAALLLCMSSNMVRFALSLACTKNVVS